MKTRWEYSQNLVHKYFYSTTYEHIIKGQAINKRIRHFQELRMWKISLRVLFYSNYSIASKLVLKYKVKKSFIYQLYYEPIH